MADEPIQHSTFNIQHSGEALLAEVREQVRLREARGGAGAGEAAEATAGGSLRQLRRSVEEVNNLAAISAHLPIPGRGAGLALAYAKRALRVLLRWYINPIVEQQNRYNAAVAHGLTEITAYEERLMREWQLLEERAFALEEQARTRGPAGRS